MAHSPVSAEAATTAIPFDQPLRYLLKLGFISFGGPARQIAVMHQELVGRCSGNGRCE